MTKRGFKVKRVYPNEREIYFYRNPTKSFTVTKNGMYVFRDLDVNR